MLNYCDLMSLLTMIAGPSAALIAAHLSKLNWVATVVLFVVAMAASYGLAAIAHKVAYRALSSKLNRFLAGWIYLMIPLVSLNLAAIAPVVMAALSSSGVAAK